MWYAIQTFGITLWDMWCVPFGFVPYGDPYGATAALFIASIFAAMKIINS